MFGLSREKSVVGLDIGSYSVKAVELRPRKKGGEEAYELVKIGYEPLPHDAIVEGTIIDSAAVVETIRLVFEENKISTKDVAISISGNSVIIKKISLPVMEKQELAESIIWEAKHNIPYPYEETNVDYAILKPSRTTDEKNLDILLVAAKKEKIANYSNVIAQARKNLQTIEVDVFSLQNVLEICYPDVFANKTLALINIGANITNVVIVERGTPQLFRDLSLGGFFFTENIRKELSISFEEAEKLLKGIPGKSTTPDQFASAADDERPGPPRRDREDLLFLRGLGEAGEEDRADHPQRRPGQRHEHGQRLRNQVPDQDGDPQSLPQYPGR